MTMSRHPAAIATALLAVAAVHGQEPIGPLPPSSVSVQQNEPAPGELPPTVAFDRPLQLQPKIRNITTLHNSMPQALVGLGLVVGLAGTGSTDRGSRLALLNYIHRQGLNLTIADVTGGSVALVTLTCELPPFAKVGDQLDVKCAVIGDATSLRNGQLLRGELHAVDGDTYVLAQGLVNVNGFSAQASNSKVQQNHTVTGWVNNGGQVVKDLESTFWSESGCLELRLLNPSPFNAAAIAAGVRSAIGDLGLAAEAVDQGLVRIPVPREQRSNATALRLLNLIGEVRVTVENPAKVVIDQASGTVLAGEGVLISPCVVGLSELTIAVMHDEDVVQPNPFGNGDTQRIDRTRIDVQNNSKELKPLAGGATVGDLLANLKTLGLTPSQLIAVFTALDGGGFLQAKLELR